MVVTLLICLGIPLGGLLWISTRRQAGVRRYPKVGRAFAAGMVVGLVSRGETSEPLREKLDGLGFGFHV